MLYTNISLLVSFLFSFSLMGCAGVKTSNENQHVFTHDGYEREYLRHIPTNVNKNEKAPLLFVLHGGGGTNNQMEEHTKFRFNQLADRDGFYVVYPQGLKKGWNDGRDLKQFSSQNDIDDVGFIRALIYKFKDDYQIDEDRVFVTGISNGGFMSFRLGCELRDEIRAIAPVTASIAEDVLKYCRGKSDVSLALLNGTDDPLVPYEGGQVKVLRQKRGMVTSTQDTIEHWSKMLDCVDLPKKQELPDTKDDGTTVTKFEYDQCERQSRVTLFRISGGGHTWPSSILYGRTYNRIVGTTSQQIVAANEIWKFFRQLP